MFHSIMSLLVGKWGATTQIFNEFQIIPCPVCSKTHYVTISVVTYSLVGISFKIKLLIKSLQGLGVFFLIFFFNLPFTVSLICMKLMLITSNWNFKKPWTRRYPLSSPSFIRLVTLKTTGALFSCDWAVLLLTVTFNTVTDNSSSVYWSTLSLLLRNIFLILISYLKNCNI